MTYSKAVPKAAKVSRTSSKLTRLNFEHIHTVQVGKAGEVLWQIGYENGKFYSSSYSGEHYTIELGQVDLHFNQGFQY